jgi:phosphoglycolate/pyridoxal phosphate phosphatase family enzyme
MGYKGFIFDIDGVLCRGDKPIPGAKETIAKLREAGIKIVFLSNLSTKSREEYVEKLHRLGIPAEPEDLVLATSAIADYVAKHCKSKKVYWVGARGLRKELEKAGLIVVEEPEEAEFVVAGSPFDEKGYVTEENRWKFTGALRAIKAGAKFVAVNPDPTFPGKDGKLLPGTGAFIGAVKAMTGVEPVIVGKPSPVIVQMALEKLGLKPDECVMVGDQIDTDMKAGKSAGLTTVLVLTGVTSREDLEKVDKSKLELVDYVFDSVNDVLKLI